MKNFCFCCGKRSENTIQPDNLVAYSAFGDGESPSLSSVGRLLLLVNPHSGAGKSKKVLLQSLLPKLHANKLQYEIVVTEGAGFARKMMRQRDDLLQFHAIVILSGDGLIYEIINGIMERDDRDNILANLPIGIVPSGSGNGLLASVFHYRGFPMKEKSPIPRAIDLIACPQANAHPLNLVHVETPTEHIAAFLSAGWGLISDIDVESERWRRVLGSARFIAGAVLRALNLRTYKGRLSFLPWTENASSSSTLTKCEPYPVYSRKLDELPKIVGGEIDRVARQSGLDAIFRDKYPCTGLPSLADPVPETWTTIEDDFVLIYMASVSHFGFNGYYAPKAQLNDDKMYLTYILKRDIRSRLEIAKFLDGFDAVKYCDYPFFKTLDQGSVITVDGEVIKADRIQATITTMTTAIVAD